MCFSLVGAIVHVVVFLPGWMETQLGIPMCLLDFNDTCFQIRKMSNIFLICSYSVLENLNYQIFVVLAGKR